MRLSNGWVRQAVSEAVSAVDRRWLVRALTLAENGLFTATPNPRVGCVICRSGRVIGEGWHRAAGEAHAEIIAMRQCDNNLRDADVYVNLEPCAHEGRTPPCAPLLAAARPARVVIATLDPNPTVSGKGVALLRDAGIDVVVVPPSDIIFQQALALNIGFVSRMVRKRPWLQLKIAATLDGKTALSSGLSRWISGERARIDAHYLRARSCAILTGIGTAQADDPQLTVRHVHTPRQPQRILVDRHLQATSTLRLFAGGAIVASAQSVPDFFADGVEVLSLPDSSGRVDLLQLMCELSARGINEVLVEAGRRLSGALLAAGLVDEIVLYQAPRVFGDSAFSMFDAPAPSTPAEAPTFALRQIEPLGDGDIKIIYDSLTAQQQLTAGIIDAATAKNA
ncbi:bifunctional diaminohydroxyphosphoribosylaminopyrimidine deaminase/5-amino-6-(5-phosphoribosylamino)uracil reductase RibD [Candidatus Persebacteraceae bacterium Df01]|uniref:Riboflavin biosynthesis protein RibD n=1 Tax=Candidatus Doriopsillibacter californiensis TaxID=2970740 RepID=A0ABT7QKT6_9GAMM|nr:bifunctional diaminohydroxyphosphoribosylaminopyrimidine deaminase/5-amino-6-(5-phosphoribosylamino)uracil reductase RibD [Candidatus Persebacteraceae bacterium Df01]